MKSNKNIKTWRDALPGPYYYDQEAQTIFSDEFTGMMLNVRGWGHLTGVCALNLPAEKATEIQDAMGSEIASMLNKWENVVKQNSSLLEENKRLREAWEIVSERNKALAEYLTGIKGMSNVKGHSLSDAVMSATMALIRHEQLNEEAL